MSWDAPVRHFEHVDSTMNVARAWAEAGAPEGSTVVAAYQEGGRGRHGRPWFSPPGAGLWSTIIMRPPAPDSALALVAGLATWRAVATHGALEARLKWPNDVVVGERKLAGILLQTDGWNAAPYVLVGIGINLAPGSALPELPAALASRYIGLAELTATPVGGGMLLATLRSTLHDAYRTWLAEGLAPVLAAWEPVHALQGAWVQAESSDGRAEGQVCGLGGDGQLCLRAADGTMQQVWAGEVTRVQRREPAGGDLCTPM